VPDTSDATAPARLRFERPPGAISVFLRALLDKRPARLAEGATAGSIKGRIEGLDWSGSQLRRYRDVCKFPDGRTLPICFPHVLASGLHARMLMRPEFPVRLPGLIHVWHEIRLHRPLDVEERLAMECSIDGHRDVDAGAEFCLQTRVIADRAVVWEEETGFISRSARRGSAARTKGPETPPEVSRTVAEWTAETGVGRRYARASGDYNPIHLFDAAARRFGFPAAIAHGMWTLARAVSGLEHSVKTSTRSVRVRFRRPVLIPTGLRLVVGGDTAAGVPFEVRESEGDEIVLDGLWTS